MLSLEAIAAVVFVISSTLDVAVKIFKVIPMLSLMLDVNRNIIADVATNFHGHIFKIYP